MVLLQQLLVVLQNAWHDGAGMTDFLPFSDCHEFEEAAKVEMLRAKKNLDFHYI